MNLMNRIRTRHADARRARAIDRAVRSASTPAARNELIVIAQRYGA
jgi:hypothetical protein